MKLSIKELTEQFICFEEENDLFNWEVNGVYIWELIRIPIFNKLTNTHVSNNFSLTNLTDRNSVRILFAIFYFFYNALFRNPFLSKRNSEILILNHPRRKYVDQIYQDIYTDTFLNNLPFQYAVIERYQSLKHYKPVSTQHLYYLDYLELPSRFIHLINKIKIADEQQKRIIDVENKLLKHWRLENFSLEKLVKKFVLRYDYLYPRIDKLVAQFNPAALICVVSYSFINQIFFQVARKRGIPSVELQHGTVSKYHIAYNYKSTDLKYFPDYFFAWGMAWLNGVRLPLKSERIKAVGYPYLDTFKSKKDLERNNRQVLIISQMRQDLANFALELSKQLKDHKFIFKAHPSEYERVKDEYEILYQNDNIEVIGNDSRLLYELFRESNYIFGVFSTALIEATLFCPNVIILKYPGWEYFEELEGRSNIHFLSDVNEAVLYISENRAEKKDPSKLCFFNTDAIANLNEEIRKIVGV